VAKRNGYSYGIPKENTTTTFEMGGNVYKCDIFDLFVEDGDCNLYESLATEHYYEDLSSHFNPQVFAVPDNTDILGYFQGEQYFLWCEEIIRHKMTFKECLLHAAKNYTDVSRLNNPIAVHVRRGDYLNLQNVHPIPSEAYYTEALKRLNSNNRDVLLFSDDVNWVKSNLANKVSNPIVVDSGDQSLDMILMSQCNDFVIANSSFSWWASWLCKNPDKRILCPKVWLGNEESPLQKQTRKFEEIG
jgi:hypothetical protein